MDRYGSRKQEKKIKKYKKIRIPAILAANVFATVNGVKHFRVTLEWAFFY